MRKNEVEEELDSEEFLKYGGKRKGG